MKERPILMSGPMVRAILEGKKSQTRRVITPQPERMGLDSDEPGGTIRRDYWCMYADSPDAKKRACWPVEEAPYWTHCPYGQPGDRLWARERHHVLVNEPDSLELENYRPRRAWSALVSYDTLRAGVPAIDETREVEGIPVAEWRDSFDNDHIIWRPSIHMPRWASRLTLEITEVRVERVQEITYADAISEGVESDELPRPRTVAGTAVHTGGNYPARDRYRDLWDSLNKARGYGWDANPWVWVLAFRRVTEP